MKKFKGLRHGEVALVPAKRVSGTKLPKGDFILAHSETGHHHVLEGNEFEVIQDNVGQLFIDVINVTNLVHRKTYDKHKTVAIPRSFLKRYEMVEYNPASDAIQRVKD